MQEKPDFTPESHGEGMHEGIHREYKDGIFGEAWVLCDRDYATQNRLLTLLNSRNEGEANVGHVYTICSADDCYYDVYAFTLMLL